MVLLAIVILADSALKWYGYLFLKRPYTTTEVAREAAQEAAPELARAHGDLQ